MHSIVFGIHNVSFFDSYWVAVHFGAGLLVGFAVDRYFRYRDRKFDSRSFARIGFSLLLLWEYFEVSLRYIHEYQLRVEDFIQTIIPDAFFSPESITNITSDLIIGSFGLYLAYRYLRREPSDPDDSIL